MQTLVLLEVTLAKQHLWSAILKKKSETFRRKIFKKKQKLVFFERWTVKTKYYKDRFAQFITVWESQEIQFYKPAKLKLGSLWIYVSSEVDVWIISWGFMPVIWSSFGRKPNTLYNGVLWNKECEFRGATRIILG